jgi:hypothetical protein
MDVRWHGERGLHGLDGRRHGERGLRGLGGRRRNERGLRGWMDGGAASVTRRTATRQARLARPTWSSASASRRTSCTRTWHLRRSIEQEPPAPMSELEEASCSAGATDPAPGCRRLRRNPNARRRRGGMGGGSRTSSATSLGSTEAAVRRRPLHLCGLRGGVSAGLCLAMEGRVLMPGRTTCLGQRATTTASWAAAQKSIGDEQSHGGRRNEWFPPNGKIVISSCIHK